MGLMSILFGSKALAPPTIVPLPIDLGAFKCGLTLLGSQPGSTEPYADHFDSNGTANFDASGIELGIKDGVLDYAFITMANFSGKFLKNGSVISISTQSTPEEIVLQFGEPYWTDNKDDDETILFYEYQNGRIELQFEFPGKRELGFITLSRNGVLSQADQRKAYGVAKNWPPT
jgi:hypothetical protein